MVLKAINQLALVPLGAGDLIDRAVRLYRRHFMTLIRIAAPPVIINMLGSLLLTLGGLSALSPGSVILLSLFWFLAQITLNVIVIGGAARNLITHLFWDEPFSARNTYRNVRARFASLLGAGIVMAGWILIAIFICALVWAFIIRLFIFGGYVAAEHSSFAVVLLIVWILAVTFLAFLLFFLMVKFIAYVPQVLMIEGRGVFDSVGRSFTLARGNLRRLMAMALFYWGATYSALMILIIPLYWYGYAQGINILPNASAYWPTWFSVGQNVIQQLVAILIVPVLMLGLSLMYVDERVRQEGYDIELMATRQLVMPNVYANPGAAYQQAAVMQPQPAPSAQHYSPGSTLGLS